MRATQRLYLTWDRTRVVPESHPDGRHPFCKPGDEVPDELAKQYGLLPNQAVPPEGKRAGIRPGEIRLHLRYATEAEIKEDPAKETAQPVLVGTCPSCGASHLVAKERGEPENAPWLRTAGRPGKTKSSRAEEREKKAAAEREEQAAKNERQPKTPGEDLDTRTDDELMEIAEKLQAAIPDGGREALIVAILKKAGYAKEAEEREKKAAAAAENKQGATPPNKSGVVFPPETKRQ